MKIIFLNEAGPFGSYKKSTAKSNISNVKRDLTREATNHILEKRCDELAELYLDMLNEVNSKSKISTKFIYNLPVYNKEDTPDLVELSNYVANNLPMHSMMSRKDIQLNIIKNVYCNKLAIDYMISKGCFILPLVDMKHRQIFLNDTKEIIPYKNMTKTVAEAAEKVIKSHLSKFPNYASIIPNTVKIIILPSISNNLYRSKEEQEFISYMGIKDNGVEFEYPGQGSSCLKYILDTFSILTTVCTIKPIKSNEHIWKAIADPSPWMLNNFAFRSVYTDIYTISADNFYGIKLLKFALDNNILYKEHSYIIISINNVLKNIQHINTLNRVVSKNGLDDLVEYRFNDMSQYVESFIKIGKEITSEQAEQEGIAIDDLKRSVYEFDYNNVAEVKSAAKVIIGGCYKFLTDPKIKKMAEDKMEEYLPVLMSKVLASRPNCISSSNKILLCDYHKNQIQKVIKGKVNVRVVIDPNKIGINKKGNLVFYIDIDFKLPVIGVNTKYNSKHGKQNSGKNYEYITGKKIKIEIPL